MKFEKGEIICRLDEAYPEDALVCDGYDDAGRLMAHPLGGGMQLTIPLHLGGKFRPVDEAERSRALFRRGKFSLPDLEEVFAGWTNGEVWNGWAKPYFERAEAERLLACLKAEGMGLDGARDAFVTVSPDGDEEVWAARAVVISDGSVIRVYPIGAGCWCWDEVAERGAA